MWVRKWLGEVPGQFGRMVVRPGVGVAAVLTAGPGIGQLAVILGLFGLLRGVVEGLWYYLMTGRLHELPVMLGRADWYFRYGGPFLLLNIPSAHFLWFTTAVVLFASGRILGGMGAFRPFLQVFGVAMLSYLGIGILNYLHVWWPLPSLTLDASPFYRPNLGVGQLVTFAWLTAVGYQAQRRIHHLPPLSAALAAPLPVLVSLLLYLLSAGLFFRLVPHLPGGWRPADWLALANGTYLAATVGLTAVMAVATRSWLKAGGRDGT